MRRTLSEIESYIDFVALVAEVDRVALRPLSARGGRPSYPTETMVKIGQHHQENRCVVGEVESNSLAVIFAQRDLLKISGYSRCPIV